MLGTILFHCIPLLHDQYWLIIIDDQPWSIAGVWSDSKSSLFHEYDLSWITVWWCLMISFMSLWCFTIFRRHDTISSVTAMDEPPRRASPWPAATNFVAADAAQGRARVSRAQLHNWSWDSALPSRVKMLEPCDRLTQKVVVMRLMMRTL